MKSSLANIMLFLILFSGVFAWGQGSICKRNLELPANTVHNSLANGFHYVIKANESPKDKLEVKLCLRVGSTNETEGEEGIAHFIEHLAFDGSKQFPKNQAVEFWENLGAKFGSDINAYTGYDRTVYTLSIPLDEKGNNLNKTLSILADWLVELNLEEDAISKQKKIVCEEIASYELPDELHELKKGQCPHLKRLPIGTEEQVFKLDRNKIRNFYQKWYSTKNAALIVVGDVSVSDVEKAIRKNFGNIVARGVEAKTQAEISYSNTPLFFQKMNTLTSRAKVSWMYPYCYHTVKSFDDLYEEKKRQFVLGLVAQRLHNHKSAMLASRYWYLQQTGFLDFSISSKQNIINDFSEAMAIIEGVKKEGITPLEVDQYLPEFIDSHLYLEEEKESEVWASDFVEMFLFREQKLFTLDDKRRVVEKLKKETILEWNMLLREVLEVKKNPLVTYTFNPQRHENLSYDDFYKAFTHAKSNVVTGFNCTHDADDSVISVPNYLKQDISFQEEMFEEQAYFANIGVHYFKLSNGAKLYLKQTKKDARLNLNFIFRGGLSLLPKSKFKQMEELLSYIGLGGLEQMGASKFYQLLSQEEMMFVYTNENYFHGIVASAPLTKTELLCNVVMEKLLHPELCYKDFEEIRKDNIASFSEKRSKKNPMQTMSYRLEELKCNLPIGSDQEKNIEDISSCNLDSLFLFYKKNYLNPQNLVCIATGDFDVDSLKIALAGSLLKLPVSDEESESLEQTVSFPYERVNEKVGDASNERLHFNMLYYGTYQNNLRNQLILKLMRDALRSRLLLELREKESVIYSPYVDLNYKTIPFEAFFLNVNGTTSSKHCELVQETVERIIKRLKSNAIDRQELDKMKRSFLNARKAYLAEAKSSHWRDYLQDSHKRDLCLEELNDYEEILRTITAKDILVGFQDLLVEEQRNFIHIGTCGKQ